MLPRISQSRATCALLTSFLIPFASSAAPLITEFMASNSKTITDEDGESSDWIEIFNPDGVAIDLGGYYLTDDAAILTKWRIPSPTILDPASFLVVFASDKNRAVPGSPLHTNFKLTSKGEYLALVAQNGTTIVDEYAPSYPAQFTDFSYGLQQLGNTSDEVLFGETAACTCLVPASGLLGNDWTAVAFDDSSWTSGTTGVGYERSNGYQSLINIDVEAQMYNQNTSVYVRIPFRASGASELAALTLRMKYDDGFVAYLNGTKIADERAPASPTWNSAATADHPDGDATSFSDFDVSAFAGLLREGDNLLAIHGLNRNLTSSDMLIRAELVGTRLTDPELGGEGYLNVPTPGAINGFELGLPASAVVFSEGSRTFSSPLSISLSGATAGQTIRYTTDGSPPTTSSPEYAAPIPISTTTQIRAKIFGAGGASSATATETYLYLNSDIRGFKSNLPIVILDNFGGGRPDSSSVMFMAIIRPDELGDGLAEITDSFQVATRGTMKVRGSSSSGWPKYSMTIEAWDGDDFDHNITPLDLPSESDWVLGSKYQFDRALMRNDLAYRLSNDLGEYAARTRHVEVVNNTGGGNLSYSDDYFGVYSLTEKIKRDDDRIDVDKLLTTDDAEPEITGGYLFKKDRLDPGDSGFSANGMGTLGHVYPKEDDITTAQRSWLQGYLNEFNAAVSSATKTHPSNGKPFTDFIIVDSWLKHHWVNTITMNVDGFRLSGYYYKDRLGKLGAGPVWDFDRTMESTDGRDNDPQRWDGTGDSSKTWYDSRYTWWGEALEDPDFKQLHTDMWQRERDGGALSWANIESVIDEFNAKLNTVVPNSGGIASTAQQRNFNKWTSVPPRNGGHAGEITILKNWLQTRGTWIDSQFTARPAFTVAPGVIPAGTAVSFSGAGGTVYYTTDGSDPRASGGAVAGGASSSLPVTVNNAAVITARARNGSEWSGPIQGSFLVGPLASSENLAITEVHYAPAAPTPEEALISGDPSDYEFIELQNVSAADTISMLDVQFIQGIDFTFTGGDILSLAPGERVLVVRNQDAFEARYGKGQSDRIAGEFLNESRLDNDGETIHLVDALGADIAFFTYNDQLPWPFDAGFPGYSLVLIDNAMSSPYDYDDAMRWRSSTTLGGSPNTSDSIPFSGDPDADLDGDGLEAFLEHALGTADTSGSKGQEAVELELTELDITGVPVPYLTVSYQRNLAADDVVMFVESAPEPTGSWSRFDMVLHSETNNGDGTSTVVYRSGNPFTKVDLRLFCRITAEKR